MRQSAIPAISSLTVDYAVPAALGTFVSLAILAAGYPLIALSVAGATISLLSMISARFGIALLLVVSALFTRSALFDISLPFFGGGLKPTDILLASVLSGWLARSLLKSRFPGVPGRAAFFLAAFILWAATGVLIGMANGAFYKHSLLELRPLLHFLLIFPIASDFTKKDVERALALLLAVSVAVSLKALYLYTQGIGEQALFSEGNIRVTSIEFLYLVASALAAIAMLLNRRGPAPVLLGIFFLNCAALAVTFQRAAWLALLMSILLLIIANRDFRRGVLTAGAIAALGLAAGAALNFADGGKFMNSLQGRMSSVSSYESDISALHRLEEWKASLNMIRAHPIAGSGLGARVYFYSPMYSESKRTLGYLSDDYYIHNSFVWIGVKTGAIGTLLFILFLATVYKDAIKYLVRAPPGGPRSLAAMLTSILAAVTISAIFGPMLNSDLASPLAAFTIGSFYVLENPHNTRRAFENTPL